METPLRGILKKFGLGKKPSQALIPAAPSTATKKTEEIVTSPIVEPVSKPAIKELPKPNPTAIMARGIEAMEKTSDVIVIPAAPGNEEVRILTHPGYHKIDHGQIMISYKRASKGPDYPAEHRAKPTYFASYLAKFGSEPGLRMITFPVALFRGIDVYNNEIIAEMQRQGFTPEEIRQNCDQKSVNEVCNAIEINYLPILRNLLRVKQFVLQKPYPPAELMYIDNKNARLNSGWNPNRRELVIIDNTYSTWDGTHNYLHCRDTDKAADAPNLKMLTISQPFTPNSIGEYEARIVEKILRFNRDNFSDSQPRSSSIVKV